MAKSILNGQIRSKRSATCNGKNNSNSERVESIIDRDPPRQSTLLSYFSISRTRANDIPNTTKRNGLIYSMERDSREAKTNPKNTLNQFTCKSNVSSTPLTESIGDENSFSRPMPKISKSSNTQCLMLPPVSKQSSSFSGSQAILLDYDSGGKKRKIISTTFELSPPKGVDSEYFHPCHKTWLSPSIRDTQQYGIPNFISSPQTVQGVTVTCTPPTPINVYTLTPPTPILQTTTSSEFVAVFNNKSRKSGMNQNQSSNSPMNSQHSYCHETAPIATKTIFDKSRNESHKSPVTIIGLNTKIEQPCSPHNNPAPAIIRSRMAPTKSKSLQQLYLDLGQRDFGKQTICKTCGMLFVHGLKDDTKNHNSICKQYKEGVSFVISNLSKTSDCRIVSRFPINFLQQDQSQSVRKTTKVTVPSGGCLIVEVRSTDSLKLLKKVEDVRFIVNQELGFVTRSKTVVHLESESVPSSKTTYLCIYNSRVVGMIIVEGIQKAYRLLLVNPDFDTSNEIEIATKMTKPKSDTQVCQLERSTVCQPATLGVHILWVHSNYRNLGIARRLLDIAREKMFYGFVVPVEFLAFSSPTQAGALFAVRYCSPLKNERNTLSGCNVLVYDCQ